METLQNPFDKNIIKLHWSVWKAEVCCPPSHLMNVVAPSPMFESVAVAERHFPSEAARDKKFSNSVHDTWPGRRPFPSVRQPLVFRPRQFCAIRSNPRPCHAGTCFDFPDWHIPMDGGLAVSATGAQISEWLWVVAASTLQQPSSTSRSV